LNSSVLKYEETTAERQVGLASITSNPNQCGFIPLVAQHNLPQVKAGAGNDLQLWNMLHAWWTNY